MELTLTKKHDIYCIAYKSVIINIILIKKCNAEKFRYVKLKKTSNFLLLHTGLLRILPLWYDNAFFSFFTV